MRVPGRHGTIPLIEIACGMTIDLFCEPGRSRASAQWLWSAPLHRISERGLDERAVLDRLSVVTRRAGFHPDPHASAHRMLTNGSDHEAACPFSRDECTGPHVVVTGAGRIGARHLSRAAWMVEAVGAHSALPSS